MILSGGLRSPHRGTYFNHGRSHRHAALTDISLTDTLQREINVITSPSINTDEAVATDDHIEEIQSKVVSK